MKDVKYLLIALFITLFFTVNTKAQTQYNLQQCIAYTLKYNPSVIMSNNDVDIAYARKREGQSAYLPQVYGQLKWDDNLKLQSTQFPSMSLGGITIPEQTLQIGNKYNTAATLQLEQMIFNWSYIQGIKAIQPGYEIAKMKKEKTQQDLVYNTIAAYYTILLINENEKLIFQNEERLSKTISILKLQKEKGVIRQVDVDKVQVSLNTILSQEEILAANKSVAFNNLKYAMGMPLDSIIAIDTVYNKEVIDLKTYSDTANVRNRIELQLMRKNIQLQGILQKRITAGYMPQISFYARYGANAFGSKFSKSFTNWHDFSALGFSVDIPIFDGLRTSSSLRQSKLNIANLKEDLKQKEEGLKLQLINAQAQMDNAVENLNINKANYEMARNILDVTTLQYQKGVISYTDWIGAEYAFKEAEQNYFTAMVKYIQSKLDVDRANNNIYIYK
ncbi:MAG TPA: TolC family protein [Chitinophagales bacterium]|nr:TolC family protein [Chitinophagales bacterium]